MREDRRILDAPCEFQVQPTYERAIVVAERHPDLADRIVAQARPHPDYLAEREAAVAVRGLVLDDPKLDVDEAAAAFRALKAPRVATDEAHRAPFQAAVRGGSFADLIGAWREWIRDVRKVDQHGRVEHALRVRLALASTSSSAPWQRAGALANGFLDALGKAAAAIGGEAKDETSD